MKVGTRPGRTELKVGKIRRIRRKGGGKVAKEVQVPVDQHIEEKQQSADPNAMQPLSQIIPILKSQIAPYRTVLSPTLPISTAVGF
ncbi:putative cellulose synthase (UDP-forming) [Helianthus annuus]|uniref:Cellulose synthase (UDP-forming) n=1 Tax=Helianthus annuus TaxID=4232 RepID=A0A9K3I6V3_HELAN|nr:putative cellulose synthase (UDP-forming) [Helianthus annuus]